MEDTQDPTSQLENLNISERSFTLFPKLPKELQITIWETAHEGREVQVVTIQGSILETYLEGDPDRRQATYRTIRSGRSGRSGIPGMLHANQASREIALVDYALRFRNVDGKPKFFDRKVDKLQLKDCEQGWKCYVTGCHPDLGPCLDPTSHQNLDDDLALVHKLVIQIENFISIDTRWGWFLSLQELTISTMPKLSPRMQQDIMKDVLCSWEMASSPRMRLSRMLADVDVIQKSPAVTFVDALDPEGRTVYSD